MSQSDGTAAGKPVRYRKEARRATRSEVSIDIGNNDWRLFPLTDPSQHGCNLGSADWPFRIGQFVSLMTSETNKVDGIVRWVRGGQVGIEFVRPLSADIVELMAPPG